MAELMSDESLRRRLSAAGRLVAARYPWGECARRHLDVYQALVASRRAVG
jgi:glycosyltransferase involved in cell wall biosynthesis